MNVDSWMEVEGWLTEAEGRKLQELARGKRVLEIGAYHGRSTVCMALVAEQVVSVDWHRGGEDIGFRDSLPDFMKNLEGHRVRGRVIPILARSEDAIPLLKGARFDLIFIDGDHGESGVGHDSDEAIFLVEDGGSIAWHDLGHVKYPAVKEYVEKLRGEYELVGSLAVVRF